MICGGPELVRHGIQFTEVEITPDWILAIEAERPSMGQQTPAQGPLQPLQTLQHFDQGEVRCAKSAYRPACFYLPDPLHNHRIIRMVWSAMEWQAKAHRSVIVCR